MHNVHIAIQELETVALMLDRIGFHLSGKVVALHPDNGTVMKVLQYLHFFPH